MITKESIALVIVNAKREFLVVKRSDDPEDILRNVWGFPAVTLAEGEGVNAGIARVGMQKLGVSVAASGEIGDGFEDRSAYKIHLTDYEAQILDGKPSVPQSDSSVSQYAEVKFTKNAEILFEAARKGSLCTQIYLNSKNISWN